MIHYNGIGDKCRLSPGTTAKKAELCSAASVSTLARVDDETRCSRRSRKQPLLTGRHSDRRAVLVPPVRPVQISLPLGKRLQALQGQAL